MLKRTREYDKDDYSVPVIALSVESFGSLTPRSTRQKSGWAPGKLVTGAGRRRDTTLCVAPAGMRIE